MAIDAQSQRSTKILLNLSAGLDEFGKPFADSVAKLTSNLRLAASAGAAALGQMQAATPAPDSVRLEEGMVGVGSSPQRKVSTTSNTDLVPLSDWLDRLKIAKGFHADISLAEYLGVSKHLFSQWRTGKLAPTTDEAWRIALELGVNPLLVIASVEYQFCVMTKRQVWLDLAGTITAGRPVASDSGRDSPQMDVEEIPSPPAAPAQTDAAPVALGGLEAKGAKWSPEEDSRLAAKFAAQIDIPSIAAEHHRTIGAILYRLHRFPDLITEEKLRALFGQYGVTFRAKAESGSKV